MNCDDMRTYPRKKHPFSFHFENKTYKGCNFSPAGVAILAHTQKRGEFPFYHQQKLQGAAIQIEGETILIAECQICWLEMTDDGRLFGLSFSSIVPPELEKIKQIYENIAPNSEA